MRVSGGEDAVPSADFAFDQFDVVGPVAQAQSVETGLFAVPGLHAPGKSARAERAQHGLEALDTLRVPVRSAMVAGRFGSYEQRVWHGGFSNSAPGAMGLLIVSRTARTAGIGCAAGSRRPRLP